MPEERLEAIVEAVSQFSIGDPPQGASAQQIAKALDFQISPRTLQYSLKQLVDAGRLVRKGEKRWARYVTPLTIGAIYIFPMSRVGMGIRRYLSKPAAARKAVGYNRDFLDAYQPNVSFYLSEAERAYLAKVGKPDFEQQPAGTYARHILHRLLIDLSWNSSRLEGNTYSLLDTRRLIQFGEEAEGRDRLEAQMILNHKEAIEFLVEAADDIGFNRYTVLNLHALLANGLLADEAAAGRLRYIGVGIGKSAFHPLEVPHLIEECFDLILAKATAIRDPFEQAFFMLVQIPYLQPFDDVNKRVSRLAANIPLITGNLSPLSFSDVARDIYTEGVLGVYELNKVELLRDLFIWAYKRSAEQNAAVRQSLGEPDPFRFRYREALREIIGAVARTAHDRRSSVAHILFWVQSNIPSADQERFREMAERELLALHEGNIARYRIKPAEFANWRKVWGPAR